MSRQIGDAWSVRCGARPEIDIAEGIGTARAEPAFVIMRQEFGLVSGDIDTDRTLGFASLTGQAEVERFLHFFAAPAVCDDGIISAFTLGHLPKQVGAAASGVLFIAGGAVAGAHQAVLFAATLAHSDTAQGS